MDTGSDNWHIVSSMLKSLKPMLQELGISKTGIDHTLENRFSEEACKIFLLDGTDAAFRPVFCSTSLCDYMNWATNYMNNCENGSALLNPEVPKYQGFDDCVNGIHNSKLERYLAADRKSRQNCFVSLMVGERKEKKTSKWSERKWMLLRYYTIQIGSSSYILGLVFDLECDMPGAMQGFTPPKDFENFQEKIAAFMDRIGQSVHEMHAVDRKSNGEIVKYCKDTINEWVKKHSGDYAGDIACAKHGGAAVQQFNEMGGWGAVLEQMEDKLTTFWQFEHDLVQSFKENAPTQVACAISDPQAYDCPLTFVSAGFAELTGYNASFAQGRNCRFLQPVDAWRNDMLNLNERKRMRIFSDAARMKAEDARTMDEEMHEYVKEVLAGSKIINLLINESDAGIPYLNLLVMEYVTLSNGHMYIFGLQTNWMLEPRLLADINLGDCYALEKLENLRQVLRQSEGQATTLRALAKIAFTQWCTDLVPSPKQPSGIAITGSENDKALPYFGVTITNALSEEQTIFLIHTALQQGIRHIQWALHVQAKSQGAMTAARSAMTLRIMNLMKTLSFLRDQPDFQMSIRTTPQTENFFHEIYRALRTWNLKMDYWFLDCGNVKPAQAGDAWSKMCTIQKWGQVGNVGIYGGDTKILDQLETVVKKDPKVNVMPAAWAIDAHPGMDADKNTLKLVSRLIKMKVPLIAYNILSKNNKLLKDSHIKNLASENDVDPLLVAIRWARDCHMSCLHPLDERFDRIYWGYGPENEEKRSDLFTPCPCDFLERNISLTTGIVAETYDDLLTSLLLKSNQPASGYADGKKKKKKKGGDDSDEEDTKSKKKKKSKKDDSDDEDEHHDNEDDDAGEDSDDAPKKKKKSKKKADSDEEVDSDDEPKKKKKKSKKKRREDSDEDE